MKAKLSYICIHSQKKPFLKLLFTWNHIAFLEGRLNNCIKKEKLNPHYICGKKLITCILFWLNARQKKYFVGRKSLVSIL